MVPGVAVTVERLRRRHALGRDQPLQRREPMPIIGLAGIAFRPSALDLFGQRRGPFFPDEEAALVQRKRHGKGLRLPGLAKYRAIIVARKARHRAGRTRRGRVDHAASRYGSNASMDIFNVGSASAPQSSTASNTTV